MSINNKPQHGDDIVESQSSELLEPIRGQAIAPFQEFLDVLVAHADANEVDIALNIKAIQTLSSRLDQAYQELVFAGYGGVKLNTSQGISDITPTFQTLPADSQVIVAPRGVVQDIANDGIVLTSFGVWSVTVGFVMQFNDTNDGRFFNVQVYDVTEESAVAEFPVFVGRNQDGLNYTTTFLADIELSAVNDLFVIKIGDASTLFTAVILDTFEFSANYVSERRQ